MCRCSFMAGEFDDLPDAVKEEVQSSSPPLISMIVDGPSRS
jgi:hypothetical protein